jgi:hypothetical protein
MTKIGEKNETKKDFKISPKEYSLIIRSTPPLFRITIGEDC